jgi:catechol 2,3-dioxygenase-like lactoylglutathione lyase family enzyme
VEPTSLDHVALWVADRDPIAEFATAHLGMHVIERTDRFTLVGSDARRGKLTLFATDGPREPGALARIGLRVSDLAAARAALPEGTSEVFEVG